MGQSRLWVELNQLRLVSWTEAGAPQPEGIVTAEEEVVDAVEVVDVGGMLVVAFDVVVGATEVVVDVLVVALEVVEEVVATLLEVVVLTLDVVVVLMLDVVVVLTVDELVVFVEVVEVELVAGLVVDVLDTHALS